jgi:hypothetical protein
VSDHPKKSDSDAPQFFESWRSYWNFRREVARDWRYVRSAQSQRFLSKLETDCYSRAVDIPADRHFYRAQVAHHDDLNPEIGEALPGPALPQRMRPLRDRAREGRVNPKGIPCLYVASDKHTAIAESRPWIGSLVSVAVFRTDRSLRVVDCTHDADQQLFYLEGEPPPEERARSVWSHIARAFREPVTRDDDVADYAPTQVIAEVFRANGFDGVAYRSAFGTEKYNLALFDLDAATPVMCSLFEVKDVELKFEEAANPYYVRPQDDGSNSLVRNAITDIRPVNQPDTK